MCLERFFALLRVIQVALRHAGTGDPDFTDCTCRQSFPGGRIDDRDAGVIGRAARYQLPGIAIAWVGGVDAACFKV